MTVSYADIVEVHIHDIIGGFTIAVEPMLPKESVTFAGPAM
jgi:hypothetical protein